MLAFAFFLEHAAIPRTADGKPNLQGSGRCGIRAAFGLEDHVARHGMPAGSVVEGRTIPYQPGGGEAARARREPADRRSAREVLHARRAADHVHAVSLPDLPDARAHRDHVRVVAGAPHDLHQRRAGARGHRVLDGRFTRPLGRRHAGRRCEGPQRSDLVRHDRHLPQRRDARRRALHDDGCRTRSSTRPRSRIPKVFSQAVEDRDADLPAQGSRSHPRVSVPGGARRSQRRLRARSEDVVSGTIGEAGGIPRTGRR